MKHLLSVLPFGPTMRVARALLASQGFGSGSDVHSSGEHKVFELVRSDRPVLFDVGGFCGEYSAAFLSRHPKGSVFLFEPSPTHFSIAAAKLSEWPSVTCLPVALAASPGRRTLFKDAAVSGLASLTRRRLGHFNIALERSEEVDCETLDRVIDSRGVARIDLLKLDVEGHELDVLMGAEKTLKSGKIAIIQFEFGGANLDTRTTVQDFWYLLTDLRYRLHVLKPNGQLVHLKRYKEIYEQTMTTNFVAIRQGSGDDESGQSAATG